MSDSTLILYDRARLALAQARSIDEVKDVHDKAEALRLYKRQIGESQESQNVWGEIKLRAERRAGEMLSEMDRAQGQRTDLTSSQRDKKFTEAVTEVGITVPTAYRWQTIARIPEPAFEREIATVKAQNNELTTAGMLRLAQGKAHVSHNSGENEWYTPAIYIEAARRTMGSITLDPASSEIANKTVRADVFYTAVDDGLTQEWYGNVWMNPPYSQPLIAQFSNTVADKYDCGDIEQACVLVNNATETSAFQRMLESCACVCFLRTRVKFIDMGGKASGAPLQGQAILYFGRNPDAFKREFSDMGRVLHA